MKPDPHIEGLASLLVAVVLRELKTEPERFVAARPGVPGDDETEDDGRDAIPSS